MVETSLSQPPPLERLLRRIDEISTLPHVALKLMEVANDPNSSASDLKQVLENDPALSARVLRYVNSAAYAMRTKITNLQDAIAYLGLKQLRNLTMAASVAELFRKDEAIGPYRRSELWRHLVSVGICARLIAMRRQMKTFDDVFLAGLLHDIGIILADQHCHAHFAAMIRSLDNSKTLVENEQQILGFDHTRLGDKVAETWRFPDSVRAAIRWHHNSANYRGEHAEMLYCVDAANLICSLKGATSVGVQLVRLSPTAMQALSLAKEDILVLAEDLDAELARNAILFQS